MNTLTATLTGDHLHTSGRGNLRALRDALSELIGEHQTAPTNVLNILTGDGLGRILPLADGDRLGELERELSAAYRDLATVRTRADANGRNYQAAADRIEALERELAEARSAESASNDARTIRHFKSLAGAYGWDGVSPSVYDHIAKKLADGATTADALDTLRDQVHQYAETEEGLRRELAELGEAYERGMAENARLSEELAAATAVGRQVEPPTGPAAGDEVRPISKPGEPLAFGEGAQVETVEHGTVTIEIEDPGDGAFAKTATGEGIFVDYQGERQEFPGGQAAIVRREALDEHDRKENVVERFAIYQPEGDVLLGRVVRIANDPEDEWQAASAPGVVGFKLDSLREAIVWLMHHQPAAQVADDLTRERLAPAEAGNVTSSRALSAEEFRAEDGREHDTFTLADGRLVEAHPTYPLASEIRAYVLRLKLNGDEFGRLAAISASGAPGVGGWHGTVAGITSERFASDLAAAEWCHARHAEQGKKPKAAPTGEETLAAPNGKMLRLVPAKATGDDSVACFKVQNPKKKTLAVLTSRADGRWDASIPPDSKGGASEFVNLESREAVLEWVYRYHGYDANPAIGSPGALADTRAEDAQAGAQAPKTTAETPEAVKPPTTFERAAQAAREGKPQHGDGEILFRAVELAAASIRQIAVTELGLDADRIAAAMGPLFPTGTWDPTAVLDTDDVLSLYGDLVAEGAEQDAEAAERNNAATAAGEAALANAPSAEPPVPDEVLARIRQHAPADGDGVALFGGMTVDRNEAYRASGVAGIDTLAVNMATRALDEATKGNRGQVLEYGADALLAEIVAFQRGRTPKAARERWASGSPRPGDGELLLDFENEPIAYAREVLAERLGIQPGWLVEEALGRNYVLYDRSRDAECYIQSDNLLHSLAKIIAERDEDRRLAADPANRFELLVSRTADDEGERHFARIYLNDKQHRAGFSRMDRAELEELLVEMVDRIPHLADRDPQATTGDGQPPMIQGETVVTLAELGWGSATGPAPTVDAFQPITYDAPQAVYIKEPTGVRGAWVLGIPALGTVRLRFADSSEAELADWMIYPMPEGVTVEAFAGYQATAGAHATPDMLKQAIAMGDYAAELMHDEADQADDVEAADDRIAWPAGVARAEYTAWKSEQLKNGMTEGINPMEYKRLRDAGVIDPAIVALGKGKQAPAAAAELDPLTHGRGTGGAIFERVHTRAAQELHLYRIHPGEGYKSAEDLLNPTTGARVGKIFEADTGASPWLVEAPGTAGHVRVTRYATRAEALAALVVDGGYHGITKKPARGQVEAASTSEEPAPVDQIESVFPPELSDRLLGDDERIAMWQAAEAAGLSYVQYKAEITKAFNVTETHSLTVANRDRFLAEVLPTAVAKLPATAAV